MTGFSGFVGEDIWTAILGLDIWLAAQGIREAMSGLAGEDIWVALVACGRGYLDGSSRFGG